VKKRLLILAVIAAAAAGGAVWASRRVHRVKPLVLSGSIEARDVEVGSLMGGRVSKVLVEEGSAVKAGQTLVEFETDLIDLQMAQQRARIAQSRANLTKSIAGPRTEEIARARAASENAERERQRQQTLLASGIAVSRLTTPRRRPRRRRPRPCARPSGATARRTSTPRAPSSTPTSGSSPTCSVSARRRPSSLPPTV
jgi:multidrug efflux pump subunit AcrA (membrane-fusion protein)